MKVIKIGRKEYEIRTGDYILDNGACYQFCSGDGRILKQKGWTDYTNIRIPASVLKTIDLKSMKSDICKSFGGFDLVRYIFE